MHPAMANPTGRVTAHTAAIGPEWTSRFTVPNLSAKPTPTLRMSRPPDHSHWENMLTTPPAMSLTPPLNRSLTAPKGSGIARHRPVAGGDRFLGARAGAGGPAGERGGTDPPPAIPPAQ